MNRLFLGNLWSGAAMTSDHGGRSSCEGGEEDAMVVAHAIMAWGLPMDMGEGQRLCPLGSDPHAASAPFEESLAYGLPCMPLAF
jgi:hypothetical protein